MTASSKETNAKAEFTKFPAGSTRFLAALKKNNDRDWFQPRKAEFDELLHAPLIGFAKLVNAMLEKDAPQYAYPNPTKALNRIYRDTRFSSDKTPYKTNVSMIFPHQRLSKKNGAGLYFELSGTEAMLGGGLYFGETSELQAVRERLAVKHAEFRKILAAKSLRATFGEMWGESLLKTPKQFGVEHPAADLLKQKQWLLFRTSPAKSALEDGFGAEAVKSFRLLLPFIGFLNEPLERLSGDGLKHLSV